ncbi:MAG: DUF3842 family protein [Actinobacteria bacterium]|nr:DUF3842 family protein [Actinomycetota bacterium]
MRKKPVIAVIDGMGGNIGHQIVSQLRRELPGDIEIMVFGTNSAATANMMKARASRGATGENAIRVSISQADIVVAPIAAVIPNSYLGELTAGMAAAISSSRARKILLPLGQLKVAFVGVSHQPLPHLMEEAIDMVKQILANGEEVNTDV